MPLGPGTRLGPYEIQSALGSGGMGEVYRARDTRLQRDVAVKVLPEVFATDAERLARFEREAQLLASLNHPHIAAIHGLEESNGVRALILEFVDGPTLADRIAQGPIPLDEAMPIARQVAEALEAAHERGIIHRDLKPANIKITTAGAVKVLDFGLAKLAAGEPGQVHEGGGLAGLSLSPTLTSPAMTRMGVIIGTAAYMSPEQAKGRAADKRSDVWALGCVIFEMLTGRRAFEGDDVSDTLAAVLRAEPDWNALPAEAPTQLRSLIKSCLEKDRNKRVPDVSTVRFLMDHATALAPSVAAPIDTNPGSKRTAPARLWQAVAALLALTMAGSVTAWWYASRPVALATTRFFIYPPEKTVFVTSARTGTSAAISPDGRTVAFTARDASGKVQLWIRPIDSLTAQPLPGTDDAAYPFWSPDSRFIAYSVPTRLMKISASGGPPQTLCNTGLGAYVRGGSWSPDGTIVFSTAPGRGLSVVSSAGGQSMEFMRLQKGHAGYVFPWFLPDGRHFLFYTYGADDVAGVYVGSLDSADPKRLTGADTAAVYDSQNRYVLFVRQGTLLAQRFDPSALALGGESFPIAERLEASVTQSIAAFSVSTTGVLAYGTGAGAVSGLQLAWFDRQGKRAYVGPQGNYRGIDLSPDERYVAAHRHDGSGGDTWVMDLSRSTTSRFTFDVSQENQSPIWSPDGSRIVYSSIRNGKRGLYQKLANNAGTEERLLESDVMAVPMSWSPDGKSIVYQVTDTKTGNDLWMLPLSGDRKPAPMLRTPFSESHGQVSPDGKWIAYNSNESGRTEIYVQPFPSGAGKWQVSTNGGFYSRWRRDGRELFYMTDVSGGLMMAVDVSSSGSSFEAGMPRVLFDTSTITAPHLGSGNYHTFAVSADGQRFLIPYPPLNENASLMQPIVVVENWAAGLGK